VVNPLLGWAAERSAVDTGWERAGHREGCYEKSGMRLRCAASSSIVSSEGRDS
jgi:hypothetical protein